MGRRDGDGHELCLRRQRQYVGRILVDGHTADTLSLWRRRESGARVPEWDGGLLETDNQGSVHDVFASSGSVTYVLDHVNYSAFGVITQETSPGNRANLGYTGEWTDDYSGLVFAQARWYDPATGTYVTADPTGFGAGQANFYVYCGNDPTNATDPSGLLEVTITSRYLAKKWIKLKGFVDFSDQLKTFFDAVRTGKVEGAANAFKKNLKDDAKAFVENLLHPSNYLLAVALNILAADDLEWTIVVPDKLNPTTKQFEFIEGKPEIHASGTEEDTHDFEFLEFGIFKVIQKLGYTAKLTASVDRLVPSTNDKPGTARLRVTLTVTAHSPTGHKVTKSLKFNSIDITAGSKDLTFNDPEK